MTHKLESPMLEKKDQLIVNQAVSILENHLSVRGIKLDSSDEVKKLCILKLSLLKREVFSALMLNNNHELIGFVELASGTIDAAAIYPREVIKSVLDHNAAACIFTHNHPSGYSEPSGADKAITKRLSDALSLIDVRVLDHIVVGGTLTTSFAEQGLL